MYHLRLKILILLCLGGLTVAVGRLIILQSLSGSAGPSGTGRACASWPPSSGPTIRGKILDRNGRTLALDRPAFLPANQLRTDPLHGLPLAERAKSGGPSPMTSPGRKPKKISPAVAKTHRRTSTGPLNWPIRWPMSRRMKSSAKTTGSMTGSGKPPSISIGDAEIPRFMAGLQRPAAHSHSRQNRHG